MELLCQIQEPTRYLLRVQLAQHELDDVLIVYGDGHVRLDALGWPLVQVTAASLQIDRCVWTTIPVSVQPASPPSKKER